MERGVIMWSKDKIDLTADILTSKKKKLNEMKKEIEELEVTIMQYFDELSSDTNMATMLVGGRNTIKRSLTKTINPDDLRVAERIEKCTVKTTKSISVKENTNDK
jgi:hypothetical protein